MLLTTRRMQLGSDLPVEHILRLVDFPCQVWASTAVWVVCEHDAPVGILDLCFREVALSVRRACKGTRSVSYRCATWQALLLDAWDVAHLNPRM